MFVISVVFVYLVGIVIFRKIVLIECIVDVFFLCIGFFLDEGVVVF